MLTITGSHPVLITYTDGSSHEYSLEDPVLLGAIEYTSVAGAGEPVPTLERVEPNPSATVHFAWLDWPADAVIVLHGHELSIQEASDRFTAFMVQAIHSAVGRAKE